MYELEANTMHLLKLKIIMFSFLVGLKVVSDRTFILKCAVKLCLSVQNKHCYRQLHRIYRNYGGGKRNITNYSKLPLWTVTSTLYLF